MQSENESRRDRDALLLAQRETASHIVNHIWRGGGAKGLGPFKTQGVSCLTANKENKTKTQHKDIHSTPARNWILPIV